MFQIVAIFRLQYFTS